MSLKRFIWVYKMSPNYWNSPKWHYFCTQVSPKKKHPIMSLYLTVPFDIYTPYQFHLRSIHTSMQLYIDYFLPQLNTTHHKFTLLQDCNGNLSIATHRKFYTVDDDQNLRFQMQWTMTRPLDGIFHRVIFSNWNSHRSLKYTHTFYTSHSKWKYK